MAAAIFARCPAFRTKNERSAVFENVFMSWVFRGKCEGGVVLNAREFEFFWNTVTCLALIF
jgi:hypothetical protein